MYSGLGYLKPYYKKSENFMKICIQVYWILPKTLRYSTIFIMPVAVSLAALLDRDLRLKIVSLATQHCQLTAKLKRLKFYLLLRTRYVL